MRKASARLKLHSEWRRRVPVDGFRIAIGNRLWSAANSVTNSYAANSLNQYTSVSAGANPVYDADGNMTGDGTFAYAYDAENRLVSACPLVPSNGALAVENCYDICYIIYNQETINEHDDASEILERNPQGGDGVLETLEERIR